jgi:hypothetical protein
MICWGTLAQPRSDIIAYFQKKLRKTLACIVLAQHTLNGKWHCFFDEFGLLRVRTRLACF